MEKVLDKSGSLSETNKMIYGLFKNIYIFGIQYDLNS